jgi:hypothetical protein
MCLPEGEDEVFSFATLYEEENSSGIIIVEPAMVGYSDANVLRIR